MLLRALGVITALLVGACRSEGDGTVQAQPMLVERGAAVDAAPAPPPPPVPNRAEHAIWRMAPNRHLAHRIVGGDLVVDAGEAGFARYTRFGLPKRRWRRSRVDGVAAAVPEKGASVELPLTAAQATSARALRLRVHARDAGTLTVTLREARGRAALVPGWQDVAVDLAGWREGENLVGIAANVAGLRVRWIHVSDRAAAEPDPIAHVGWNGAVGGFVVGEASGVAWYVQVPEGAALVGEVAAGGPCTVEVRAGDEVLGALPRVDLAPLAGQVARLELRGRGCAGGVVFDGAIVVPGEAPAPAPDGPPPKYVVFWIMDALRADRIPTFTPGARAETPNLDRLAETGAVFRQHYVGGNESQVSHASMWTGAYPAVHTVRTAGDNQNFVIPKRLPILGRLLGQAGYYTIGVTGNGFVGASGGYTRGFREYRNLMQAKGVRNGVIPGEVMLKELLARLDARRAAGDEPTFAFIGTIDNHSPWVGHQPWLRRYDPGPYDGPFQTRTVAGPLGIYRGRMGCHKVPPARDIQRMRAIYDSAISYQDELVGDLIAALEARGIADETMIVISADHGEELFEEHRCGHGASLRESLVRVPLLVHYPPRIAARVVDEGSEGVDVLPTILDAIGAPPPRTAQGRSLRGLAAGQGAGWAQPSFASQYEYAFAVRLGRWKLRAGPRGKLRVHDLGSDPLERQNVANVRLVERRYLTDHLGLYLANRTRWTKTTWGVVSNMTDVGAAELDR